MKLVYTVASQEGYVDNDAGTKGNFAQELTLSFDCDMFWYDNYKQVSFWGKGSGRTPLTEDQIAEIVALIPTITI